MRPIKVGRLAADGKSPGRINVLRLPRQHEAADFIEEKRIREFTRLLTRQQRLPGGSYIALHCDDGWNIYSIQPCVAVVIARSGDYVA